MKLVLETDRLKLRPFKAGDAPRFHALINVPDIVFMLDPVPYPCPLDVIEAWLFHQESRRRTAQQFAFAVEHKGEMIGCVELQASELAHAYELGFWLGAGYWGNGFATEAARAVTDFAFEWLAVDDLVAGHYAENAASARVLAKLGFFKTGKLKRPCLARGNVAVDTVRLKLSRRLWSAERASAAA